MKERVALFDFCETICKFQTADRFVHFVRNRTRNQRCLYKWRLVSILRKIMIIPALTILFPKASINKRLILWQLKGFYLDELEKLALEYYVACIKPKFIVPVISEMLAKQTDGYRIIIVSGGYDLYLKCFIRDFGVKDLIATNIKIENGICSGGFDGKDCLWENKIEMLKIYCEQHDIQIDVEHSYAYSDSKTDLPLLSYVANPVVVRRSDRPQNISLNNQREIVWEN